MAEQFTPLPETDAIDGQPVDIGYNLAASEELERARQAYEREAMAAIAQQPLVEMASSGSDEEQRAEMLYNQFRGDRRSIGEDIANVGVTIAGGVGDLLQMGGDVLAHLLVARSPEVAFTTERLREKTGVRPAEQGQLLLDLLAPGPAEIVKAGSIGMVGIRNLGKMDLVKEAEKLIDKGLDKLTVFRRTGMFQDGDTWKYWKLDRDMKIDTDFILNPENYEAVIPTKPGDKYVAKLPLDNLVDDPELFEAYPSIKNHTIAVPVTRHADGSVSIRTDPRRRGSFNPETGTITVRRDNPEDFRSTLLHEIQHLTDTMEGLVNGDNPAPYENMIEAWEDASIDSVVAKYFVEGKLNAEDWYRGGSSRQKVAETMREIMSDARPDIVSGTEAYENFRRVVKSRVAENAEMIVEHYRDPEDLLASSQDISDYTMRHIRSLFGELLENKVVTEEQVSRALQAGPRGMRELAFERYYQNSGEIRARITQLIDKLDKESHEAFKNIPTTASGARGVPFDEPFEVPEALRGTSN